VVVHLQVCFVVILVWTTSSSEIFTVLIALSCSATISILFLCTCSTLAFFYSCSPSVSAPCALVVGDVLGVVGTSKPVIGAEGAAAAAEDDADCTSCRSAGGAFG
jgi:hypothetical protein